MIAKYRTWVCDQPELMASLHELRDLDLVCWCATAALHGDVLLMLANGITDYRYRRSFTPHERR